MQVVITFGYLLNLQNFASAAVSSTEPANFKYWGKDPRGVFNESIPVNDLPAPKFWDPQALRNAIAVEAPGQFTHLIQKLKRGEGISVLAWGSSITEGYGGCFNAGGVEYAKTRVRFLPRQYANSWCYITPHVSCTPKKQ